LVDEIIKLCVLEDKYETLISKLKILVDELKNMGVKWEADFTLFSEGDYFEKITWKITTIKNAKIESNEKEIRITELQICDIRMQNKDFIIKIRGKEGKSNFKHFCNMSVNLRTPMCPICHSRPLDAHRVGYDHEVAVCDSCGFHKYKD
jgi:hypothetical protein